MNKNKKGVNVLALVKNTERYVFLYGNTHQDYETILETLGEYAADPELNFTWYDSAVLSQRVRKLRKENLEKKLE